MKLSQKKWLLSSINNMKTNTIKVTAIIFVLCIALSSCKKDTSINDTTYVGYSYFPLQVGDSLLYDVHLRDKNFGDYDSSFQVLEIAESEFNDIEHRPTLRLERYVRSNETQPWVIYKVWKANINTTNVEKEEDNIIYIKLNFPLSNKTWNGNAKNTLESFDEYKYISLHKAETFNTFNFDSVLTVQQVNISGTCLPEHEYATEKYAAGVGMIYKEHKRYSDFTFEPNTCNITDTAIIFEYTEKLVWYSN